MVDYGYIKELDLPFDEAERRVTEELNTVGFGILSRIDLREKFKEKLGVDFRKYVILGACNPPHALASIEAEENIGLFLPCNVIVYEKDGRTTVGIVKPAAMMGMIGNDALTRTAVEVDAKLKQAFDAL